MSDKDLMIHCPQCGEYIRRVEYMGGAHACATKQDEPTMSDLAKEWRAARGEHIEYGVYIARLESWGDALADENDTLRARVKELEKQRASARETLHNAPELNMCNYNHDDVALLNSAADEAHDILGLDHE